MNHIYETLNFESHQITCMQDAGLSQGYDVTVGGFIIEVGG